MHITPINSLENSIVFPSHALTTVLKINATAIHPQEKKSARIFKFLKYFLIPSKLWEANSAVVFDQYGVKKAANTLYPILKTLSTRLNGVTWAAPKYFDTIILSVVYKTTKEICAIKNFKPSWLISFTIFLSKHLNEGRRYFLFLSKLKVVDMYTSNELAPKVIASRTRFPELILCNT